MKCSIMLHFIWLFTVCQNTHLGVSRIQRIKFKLWIDCKSGNVINAKSAQFGLKIAYCVEYGASTRCWVFQYDHKQVVIVICDLLVVSGSQSWTLDWSKIYRDKLFKLVWKFRNMVMKVGKIRTNQLKFWSLKKLPLKWSRFYCFRNENSLKFDW